MAEISSHNIADLRSALLGKIFSQSSSDFTKNINIRNDPTVFINTKKFFMVCIFFGLQLI
ncbi:hypothetical protein COT98_03835 [Candidatus Falkowbacteria bacterium CG10_big_fil_rev_8_21_14_0_10_39_9]|uniref:Uncharacterized protein n=1 Tax=Candidatus Falkowbacteria bacterium CG10_big_fil_rev_8_21_14_0_10_39_9 TaxID=1974566 RepID=A0A2M6WNW5_9BACT|nr:MAG: hypothetical protein COT98_03835 [Candidatus Falkowbacteria bacterium CG10_big_fil_rev_8_21_14_0_10_39_9]